MRAAATSADSSWLVPVTVKTLSCERSTRTRGFSLFRAAPMLLGLWPPAALPGFDIAAVSMGNAHGAVQVDPAAVFGGAILLVEST